MPRKTRHTKAAQPPPAEIGGFLAEVGEVLREHLAEIRELLEASQADKFDVVVTHTLDRFTRNLRAMLDAFHTFSLHNVTYVSITQDIDYTTPEGRLFMTMLEAFAQYFSDALSSHTKKGMRERAMQGIFNGEPPFGYERCDANCIGIDEEHTGCHIDPVAGPAMLKTFEKYRSGSHSYRTLAEELNRQGFRTKGRRRSDPDTERTHDDPDDAAEAVKILTGLKQLWKSAGPGRRNPLLREDVEVWPTPYGEFGRNGGDGGESNSPSRNFPDRICYKLVRRFSLAAADSRRRDFASASR